MPEDETAHPGFKVIDRRTFGPEGKRREEAAPAEQKPEAATQPAAPSAARVETDLDESVDDRPVGFDALVSYLGTTAMFQLGLLPGPSGERIPADFVNARRTIDLLEILREKTQGNLTADEAHLLDDVLYELRLSFVEVDKVRAQKRK